MKNNTVILELVDNNINLYYKNNYVIKKLSKNILNNGIIIEPDLFQIKLIDCFKRNNICKAIINPKITIIISINFNKSFQMILKNIMYEMGFTKIKYIYNFQFIDDNIMIINNTNILYKKIYLEFNNLLTEEIIFELLKSQLKEELFLIGNHDNISKIHKMLLKTNENIYLIDESKKYIINNIIKNERLQF